LDPILGLASVVKKVLGLCPGYEADLFKFITWLQNYVP
jgi:hypothetical protein